MCSNVAQVQFGASFEITCIATNAYCVLPAEFTWYSFAASAGVPENPLNALSWLTSTQLALTSSELMGKVSVLLAA